MHMTAGLRPRLTAAASRVLSPAVKRRLKGLIRRSEGTLFPFTPAQLQAVLRQLGLARGDVVMAHSAFDSFVGFRGGPLEVVRALQEVIGPDGTLLMPTIPFRRTAIEYAQGDPVFDARRTPSRMGLITEIFRRLPGVERSLHPTHSVAAWGRCADALIAGHEHSETPCGRLTPYGRLLERDARILLAGVPPNTMTFGYAIVEQVEPRLAFPVLTGETYRLRWKDRSGAERASHMRLYSPRIDHDIAPLVRELKYRGQWRERRVGRLRLVLLRARDVWDAGVFLADQGEFPRERAAP